MCLYPQLIRNPKYTANKKNGGNPPPLKDDRVQYVPIGCGDCMECRKQKARAWQIRLIEDIKTNKNGKFITLTFSNEKITELIIKSEERSRKSVAKRPIVDLNKLQGYALDNAIATTAVRLFVERWRKEFGKSIRHWLVTELGHEGTENIHLHGIVWTDESFDTIERIWQYGFIWPKHPKHRKKNYVSAQTINYTIKYVHKKDEKHKLYKSIILTSSGIGAQYTKDQHKIRHNKYKEKQTDETYRTPTGHKVALPIYWRNKIYNEEEREKLWLEKLDKEIRWVGGDKVDMKNGDKAYWNILKWHQQRNTKLGYGNGQRTWEQWTYENEQRQLKYAARMAAARRLWKEMTANAIIK